jgi:putative thioredoxin
MHTYDVQDFQQDVIERSRQIPVLVDFWADWCGPCKALGPVLEKLAEEAGGRWQLAKVDTEAHREVAGQYGIRSIPNVKLFVDGAPVDEFVGALPEAQVRRWLDEALPRPSTKHIATARSLLGTGDPARSMQARELLEGVIVDEPENVEARALLAQAALFDDPEQAALLIEHVTAGTPFDDRIVALRTIARLLTLRPDDEALGHSDAKPQYLRAIKALAARDFDAALRGFIDVVGRDRELDGDGARTACLAIFEILGADAAITREHRRALANALFV